MLNLTIRSLAKDVVIVPLATAARRHRVKLPSYIGPTAPFAAVVEILEFAGAVLACVPRVESVAALRRSREMLYAASFENFPAAGSCACEDGLGDGDRTESRVRLTGELL